MPSVAYLLLIQLVLGLFGLPTRKVEVQVEYCDTVT